MSNPPPSHDSVEVIVGDISRSLRRWLKDSRDRAIRDSFAQAAFVFLLAFLLSWAGFLFLLTNYGLTQLFYGWVHIFSTFLVSLFASIITFYGKFSRRTRYSPMEKSLERLKSGTPSSKLEDAMLALDSIVSAMPEVMSEMTDDLWYYSGVVFVIGLFLGGLSIFGVILGFLLGGTTWIYLSRRTLERIRREVSRYKSWSQTLNQQKEALLRDL
jgi:hypothetical protein